ncbi:hypothetical protein EC968_006134 [Mortierella alpina]|nr:hypothetical protein EC968_006134 [Mortierella alpina]
MQDLLRQQQHKDHTEHNRNAAHENQFLGHDPLPPAVDYSMVKPTTRYQFRALSRRAISFQMRQGSTNCCCLIIWPVTLVVACLVFSLIGNSEGRSSSGNDGESGFIGWEGLARFCTKEADPQTSTFFRINDLPHPSPGERVLNVGWYPPSFTVATDMDARSGALPCVRWFGERYPGGGVDVYANASAADAAQPDSYFTPPPSGGWFKLQRKSSNNKRARLPAIWSIPSVNQTVYYATGGAHIGQLLGSSPNVTHSFSSETWPPLDPTIVYNATTRPGTGLFGAIPVRFTTDVSGKSTRYTSGPHFISTSDQAALDRVIRDMVESLSLSVDNAQSFENMPFGSIFFEDLEITKAHAKMTMQFGQPSLREDSSEQFGLAAVKKGSSVPYITPAGLRQLVTMTQISQAMVKVKFPGKYQISQSVRALPYEWTTDNLKGYILNRLSIYLFPFGLSCLLPTLVATLVTEKEDRHRMMMAMSGLTPASYYLAHYFEFLTMHLVLNLFFVTACVAVRSQLVWNTPVWITCLIFVLWAHIQTTLAFFLSSLFSNTRKATMIVYFFVAVTCILNGVSEQIFKDGLPFAWYIHPCFAFYEILFTAIRHASRIHGLSPLNATDFAPGMFLFKLVMIILGESVVFILLTFYIDAVVPTEYGVQKAWHHPVTCWFRKKPSLLEDPESLSASSADALSAEKNDDLEGADADVSAERARVQTKYDPKETPLIISNLFHRYPNKTEPALNGLFFGVENNTVLGLLGPNGAGKSTLIQLLTGLYSATSGTAFVAGESMRESMSKVHAKIGVCPQHDILWGELTVADHLLFYSRLRGIPPKLEKQAVDYALASVSLRKFRDRQVKGLSGGERRRVSIAIALLGDNRVIFLDEPSTGLDPAVRRIIWNVINRVKINRTIVLTTHSMEEADILSDRIAIMTSGRLRCIGSSLHLKELYGTGFRLDVTSKPGRLEEACRSLQETVLADCAYKRVDKFTNSTTFEFELDEGAIGAGGQAAPGSIGGHHGLSKIFYCMSKPGMYPAIEDWGLSQTTLEDVFIRIVTDGPAAVAMPVVTSHTPSSNKPST